MTSTTISKPLSKKAQAEADRQEVIEELRSMIKPGDTVYTCVRHVSSSGMMRHIDVYFMKDNRPIKISRQVAKAIGYKQGANWDSPHESALRVGGCGMDMGFHVVYSLSSVLFRDGFKCIGEDKRCPANDHSNDWGRLSRQYDEEHADALGAIRLDPHGEAGTAYYTARAAWMDDQKADLYSRKRTHRDGGYALKQAWL